MSFLIYKEKYNIVIVGGGPAGLSAAISILQKSDLSILIIEGQSLGEERIGESCPPDTILLLKQLNLAKEFYASNHTPCPGYASVWGKEDVGYNDFIVNPLGPSWCLNRKDFDLMLVEKAIALGAKINWSTRFLDSSKLENGYELRLKNNTNKEYKIKANFVIDASGATARFAKSLGIVKTIEDKLFASVRLSNISEGKTSKQVQLEAVHNGWWYNTVLPKNRMVTMMVSEKEQLTELQKEHHKEFNNQLATTTFIAKRLEKITIKDSQYYTWPIYSGILPIIEGNNWIAIGDAASSYDPVSAQGIYKGLSDGIKVTKKVIAFFANTNDYSHNSLTKYIKQRYSQYKKNRIYIYALENRWSENNFWKNRYQTYISNNL
ncbi:FAD-dependent monooxygenase [Tenacibaculum sp.]|nr:FAD-dependent monooxygenase [Tenacibaculum sp.]